MNLTITGHGITVSPSMRQAVESKLGRMKKILQGATSVEVLFTGKKKNGHAPAAQMKVYLKGKSIVVKEYLCRILDDGSSSFLNVIDRAVATLRNALSRHNTKTSKPKRDASHKRLEPSFV